jgi:hypothetical protein
MDKFIITFITLLLTLLLAKYLTNDDKDRVKINFQDKGIKCKCDLQDKKQTNTENFTNYTKDLEIEPPKIIENSIETSFNKSKQKEVNITAQKYYQKYYEYPLEPLNINKYEVYPSNQYKYLNIGSDKNKLLKNNI